jgi:two-component system response regulator ChvI
MTDTNAPSVALIDDDRNIITSLAIALQGEGFVTRLYTDPEAGLKALSENPADVIVCDIKMPRLDGIELLRRLREKSATPFIFLTSKTDELDEALGLAMGADDYIAKPFSQRLLIARIKAHCCGAPKWARPRQHPSSSPSRWCADDWRWTRTGIWSNGTRCPSPSP